VKVHYYFSSETYREERVSLGTNDLPPELIDGFITCLWDRNWWLACVLEVIQEESRVKLTFLHPPGPSSSCKYPAMEDICIVPIDNILTRVEPRTRTGRVYSITKRENTAASELYQQSS